MKIVFLSNYFNHHQLSLSDALWQETGGDFAFVEAGEMPRGRRLLGYPTVQRPYLLRLREDACRVQTVIQKADVVIAGSAPESLVRECVRAGKLLFRYGERPLRNGSEPLKYLPRLIRWHCRNPRGKPIYLLCAGAYTLGDYAKFGLFQNRAFRWGYFPETRRYADIREMMDAKDPSQILWCGRFLELKHPEDLLTAAGKLKQEGYGFTLQFIGSGEREGRLHHLVQEYGLEGTVRFLGTMQPEMVRRYMEKAGIYVLTSDRREGWGAVLNEAMNSGCAVIASDAAGAVPFLIQDGGNGLIYESGNTDLLYEKLRYLLEHEQEQKRLGVGAYKSITENWNGEAAARRLIGLAESILSGTQNPALFADGPCSRVDMAQAHWRKA